MTPRLLRQDRTTRLGVHGACRHYKVLISSTGGGKDRKAKIAKKLAGGNLISKGGRKNNPMARSHVGNHVGVYAAVTVAGLALTTLAWWFDHSTLATMLAFWSGAFASELAREMT